jgi:hypothetical protein
MFGADIPNSPMVSDPNRYFTLEKAEVRIPNDLAFSLYYDFQVLIGMAKELPDTQQTKYDAMFCANAMVNAIKFGDNASLIVAKDISKDFFKLRSKIGYSPHVMSAVGNCHVTLFVRIRLIRLGYGLTMKLNERLQEAFQVIIT